MLNNNTNMRTPNLVQIRDPRVQTLSNVAESVRLVFTVVSGVATWMNNTEFRSPEQLLAHNTREVETYTAGIQGLIDEKDANGNFVRNDEQRAILWTKLNALRGDWADNCGIAVVPGSLDAATRVRPEYVQRRLGVQNLLAGEDAHCDGIRQLALQPASSQLALEGAQSAGVNVRRQQVTRGQQLVTIEELETTEFNATADANDARLVRRDAGRLARAGRSDGSGSLSVRAQQRALREQRAQRGGTMPAAAEGLFQAAQQQGQSFFAEPPLRRDFVQGPDDTAGFQRYYGHFINYYRLMTNTVAPANEIATPLSTPPVRQSFKLEQAREALLQAEGTQHFGTVVSSMLASLTGEEAAMHVLATQMAYFRPGPGSSIALNIAHDLYGDNLVGTYARTYSVACHELREGALYLLRAQEQGKPDIILFRGTSPRHLTGVASDLDPDSIGRGYYEDALPFVQAFVTNPDGSPSTRKLRIVGHSLGGAVAYRCMAGLTRAQQANAKVLAYSPPGVDYATERRVILNADVRIFWHEDDIVHHAGRTHLKGTVFEFVLPMADKMPGAHVEPVLAQQMWGAYGDRPAQVRVRSTAREGTANNPPLNPAEWVRGGAGSVIFEIIARTGKWCREGWHGEAQR